MAEDPKPENEQAWKRPHFEAGNGNAFVHYAVFGSFGEFSLSQKKYRSNGPPEGVHVRKVTQKDNTDSFRPMLEGPIGKALDVDAKLAAVVRAAPECMIVSGEVKDPATLVYLRDTIGLVTCLADNGGVGVFDGLTFTWYDPNRWRQDVFEPEDPDPRRHVVILVSEDARQANKQWFHTRGMRTFGRPDLSMSGVDLSQRESVLDCFNRFIHMQGLGGSIPEGQEVRMSTLPPGIRCHHAGSVSDPDFNNAHVELELPKGK